MAKSDQDKSVAARTVDGGDSLNSVVGFNIMAALGRPTSFNRIDVHELWKDHYRVNIVIGEVDSFNWRIAHSYYVVADKDGKICATTPRLQKTY
jgi:hypothetical protein